MSALLNKIFTPKNLEYTDIFERTKYLLSYRMTFFLSIGLSLLFFVLLFAYPSKSIIILFLALVASIISTLYIKFTGSYKKIIFVFNLIGASLSVYTLFFVNEQPKIVDGLWMAVGAVFSFLTLGKKWGTIITLVHAFSITLFFVFNFNEQIYLMKELSQAQIYAFSSNLFICFMIIFYLMWQNIQTTQEAQVQINETKKYLQDQLEIVKVQNDEKTVLLKEIHHRVKNNLQVIVSLLRLQSRDIKNEEAVSKFDESISRVMAMSLIHEKIYQTENFSNINLEDYFKTLANDMISTVQIAKNIELEISCKVDNLGLKPVVPIALIFNELLSNSIKYAFKETESPKITVNMNENIKNYVEFTFADNGNWKPPTRENSFGLELIDTLSEQLNGQYEVYKSNGTKYQFYFDKTES